MDGWGEIYAKGLYRCLKRLARYDLPVYVTEFGIPDNTDEQRAQFIIDHVAAMHCALAEVVALRRLFLVAGG